MPDDVTRNQYVLPAFSLKFDPDISSHSPHNQSEATWGSSTFVVKHAAFILKQGEFTFSQIENKKQQQTIPCNGNSDQSKSFFSKSTDITQIDTPQQPKDSEIKVVDRSVMFNELKACPFMLYASTEKWSLFHHAIFKCRDIPRTTLINAVILIAENIDNKHIKLSNKQFFIKWSFFLLCCMLYLFETYFVLGHSNEENLLFYQMYMGHLMITSKEYILKILNKSQTKLTADLGEFHRYFLKSVENVQVDKSRFVSHMLSYFDDLKCNFEEFGKRYLGNAVQETKLVTTFGDSEYYFIIGKIAYDMKSTLITEEEQHLAIRYLVFAIAYSDKLYVIISSLRYLSKLCYYLNQYAMALKSLKYAFKICCIADIVVFPSFVNCHYKKRKKAIKKKLKRLTCSFCKQQKCYKLKACSGCCERMYCSKSCQKKDWKTSHRLHCWKWWPKPYNILKEYVFDKLLQL